MALLFEKYSNFQKVIQAQSTQELGDLFVELILDLSDYRSIKSSNRPDCWSKCNFLHLRKLPGKYLSERCRQKKYFCLPLIKHACYQRNWQKLTDILNETRIQKAIQLLKDPTRKIAEIAYEVGFREPQYFTIAFKKYTELTPRDYRELYLKG